MLRPLIQPVSRAAISLATSVSPMDLLLLCEDRFDALDELKVGSLVI
jgi:hypothetical protein